MADEACQRRARWSWVVGGDSEACPHRNVSLFLLVGTPAGGPSTGSGRLGDGVSKWHAVT